jgi:hypothetical protein
MNFDLKKEWWVIAVVVVVLFGAGYWWYAGNGEKITKFEEGKELARPRKEGVVISDFPSEFLIEPNALISDSYSIRYLDVDANQPVVEYESKMTLEENVGAFWEVLTSYNWNVITFADPNEPMTLYYATKENKDVSIRFAVENGKIRVSVAYLKK